MRGIDLTLDGILTDHGTEDSIDRIFAGKSTKNVFSELRSIKSLFKGFKLEGLFSKRFSDLSSLENPTFIDLLFRNRGTYDPYAEVLHGKIGYCDRCGEVIQPWDHGYKLGDLCNLCNELVAKDSSSSLLDIDRLFKMNI